MGGLGWVGWGGNAFPPTAASGPQEPLRSWQTVADGVRSDGGLLFGGPDRCPWRRMVLGALVGVFRGDRMLSCLPREREWNTMNLRTGRSSVLPSFLPSPRVGSDGRPPPVMARALRRTMGDDVSDDDRWLLNAVEAKHPCERIINGMADRMDELYQRRCVPPPPPSLSFLLSPPFRVCM